MLNFKDLYNKIKTISIKSISEHENNVFFIKQEEIFFGFWKDLFEKVKSERRPLYVLAPMADVTDQAFRYMLNKYGKPDVTWTEFVSCDGLMSPGREILKRDLEYNETERPIVAQLFTSNPDNIRGAARLCTEIGFDGIDINMGCPVNVIGKQGAGAKLITMPDVAQSIIKAAQEGALIKDENDNIIKQIPVSVKTRIGYNKIEYKSWLPKILECKVPVLTVHLRTRKEMSAVPAHYELIREIQNMVKNISPSTILIINGDIKNIEEAYSLYNKYKIDGAMIGRGVFGRPWIFDRDQKIRKSFEFSDKNNSKDFKLVLEKRLNIMLEHTKLFEETLGDIKPFAIMKKHYKAYVNGFDGAAELRNKLFETNNYREVKDVVKEYLNNKI